MLRYARFTHLLFGLLAHILTSDNLQREPPSLSRQGRFSFLFSLQSISYNPSYFPWLVSSLLSFSCRFPALFLSFSCRFPAFPSVILSQLLPETSFYLQRSLPKEGFLASSFLTLYAHRSYFYELTMVKIPPSSKSASPSPLPFQPLLRTPYARLSFPSNRHTQSMVPLSVTIASSPLHTGNYITETVREPYYGR